MACYEDALDLIRTEGHRMTPQRLMVLDVLFHTEGHLSAEEVQEKVAKQYPFMDISTVYRTLQLLKEMDLANEVRLEGEPLRFEAVRPGYGHHHLFCAVCGSMEEVDLGTTLDAVCEHLREVYGFQADFTHLTIPGLCAQCASNDQRVHPVGSTG